MVYIIDYDVLLNIFLLHVVLLSVDNLCKQIGHRSDQIRLFDVLMVFPKEFFEKVDF